MSEHESTAQIAREYSDNRLKDFVGFEDEAARERSLFDGGSFFLYLAPEEGWNVVTNAVRPRFRPGRLTNDEKMVEREIAGFRAHEPERFRVGGFRGRWGIHKMSIKGNEVGVEGGLLTFPTFKAFAEPGKVDRALEYGNPAATCAFVITESGEIIFTKRSKMNDPYGDDLGASFAGYQDEQDVYRKRGLPGELTNATLEDALKTEASQELSLGENELNLAGIRGIVIDRDKIHTEFVTSGRTSIDPEEITLRSVRRDPRDFSEKIATVPYREEVVEWLLTECLNPIPPTHIGALVATAYADILKSHGEDYAQDWKKRMEAGSKQLTKRRDELVQQFYRDHPEETTKTRGKNPPRNTLGYDANYLPNEQGLPTIEDVLDQMADKGWVETERKIPVASVFDLDGVIANPETRRADREQLLKDIAGMLVRDEVVGFNTGRSLTWVKNNILGNLEDHVEDKAKLKNLIVVAEVGSSWIRYDEEGQRHESIDKSMALPDLSHPTDPTRTVKDDIREAFEKYAGTMFVDYTKEAMFTAEQNVGTPTQAFKKDQADVAVELRAILQEYGIDNRFEVDPTNIATDVNNKLQGKHLGVQRILNLMRYRRIIPEHIDTFGDSASDIKMAQEAHRQGYSTRFIATNSELQHKFTPKDTEGIDIVYTNAQLDAGTEEYLDQRLGRTS